MLSEEQIAEIRYLYRVEGEPIKGISRLLKISVPTVRKVLRSKADLFTYTRKKPPLYHKLGPFILLLEEWLEAEQHNIGKNQRTIRSFYKALQEQGYIGSYSAVCRYVQYWYMTPIRFVDREDFYSQ